MNPNKHRTELDNVKSNNIWLKMVVAGLTIGFIICAATIYQLVADERVVIVPPSATESFWVSGKRVSRKYLEDQAYYVATLQLDITPRNVEYQSKKIQEMASPETAGQLKADFDAVVASTRKAEAYTVFDHDSVSIDENNMRVAVNGDLHTYVGNTKTSSRAKTYLVEFEYKKRRIYLKTFKETSRDDPFGLKAVTGRIAPQ